MDTQLDTKEQSNGEETASLLNDVEEKNEHESPSISLSLSALPPPTNEKDKERSGRTKKRR